jgi:hypothetical protein
MCVKITVGLDVTYNLVHGQQHFEGNCYLRVYGTREMEAGVSSETLVNFNGLHGATSHKIFISVRKSSLTLVCSYIVHVETYYCAHKYVYSFQSYSHYGHHSKSV